MDGPHRTTCVTRAAGSYGLHPVAGEDLRATHSVHEWVHALNAWQRAAWADFNARPLFDAARTRRGGEALLAYGHSKALAGRTVMVQSFCKAPEPFRDNLHAAEPGVEEFLVRSGIHRVVVGHKVRRHLTLAGQELARKR